MDKKKLRSEVFELLSTFTKQEMKKFGEFLNSPYHNKSKKLIKEYSYIKKFHPDFCSDKLTLAKIHNFVYQDKIFHDTTVRNDLSDLYSLSLKFIALEVLNTNKENASGDILGELVRRNLFSLSYKFLNKLNPYISCKYGWNIDLIFQRYNIATHKVNLEYSQSHIKGENTNTKYVHKIINDAFSDLSAFYSVLIIESYFNVFLDEILKNTNSLNLRSIKFLNSDLFGSYRNIFLNTQKENPILMLTLKAFDTFNDFDNSSKYFIYKKYFLDNLKLFTKEYQARHISLLLGYCQQKKWIKLCENQFNHEILSLFDIQINNKLFDYGDMKYLHPTNFKNMLTISLENKQFDWAKKLIENKINILPISERTIMKNLGYMYLNFYQKQYSESLSIANKINIHTKTYKFDIYNTRLKIYYEMKEYDSALSLIRTYTKTIKETKLISELRKERYKHFLGALNAIIKLNITKKDEFHQKILDIKKIVLKSSFSDWLTQKLDELIKEKGIK